MKNIKYLFLLGVFAVGFGWAAHAQTVGVTTPSIPSSVSASVSNQPSQIAVTWGASSESSGTIEGYYVYRNGGKIANTAGTSIIDGGLQAGLYTYTVAAYDASGTVSALSSPSTVTLLADTTSPSTPTGVTIAGSTSTNSFYTVTTLVISWNPSTDNVGVAGYQVYRDGILITTSTSAAFTGTSLTDMVPPGTYSYSVVAYDAAQNFSERSAPASVTISIDRLAPTVPTHVSVQQTAAGNATIAWATSTDDVAVAGYQIFRNNVQVASVTGSPYADSGLTAGNIYYYQVAAYDTAGNVSSLSEPGVPVTISIYNGPGVPYAISALLLASSTIKLSWPSSIDPLLVTGYAVYRNGSQVGTASSTNYLDQGVPSGIYEYNLTASDVSGAVSAMSVSSSIVVVPVFTPAPTSSSASPSATPAPVVTPATPSGPASMPSAGGTITQFLYSGLRGSQVSALQSLLVQSGYLLSKYATGYFGSITQGAVEKFQCDQNIVCTGGLGWGLVGPKTRNALNSLSAGTPTALAAEIQMLEAELASLQAKAGK